jgi:hypothetical protein
MSSETAKDCDGYARDCVRLAQQPDVPPEVREQLLQMARQWMHELMIEQNGMPTSEANTADQAASKD